MNEAILSKAFKHSLLFIIAGFCFNTFMLVPEYYCVFEKSFFMLGIAYGLGRLAAGAAARRTFAPVNPNYLQQTSSLHAAKIGIKAVKEGRERGIPQLEFMGEASVIRAALRSVDETYPRVTDEIVEDIADAGINPVLSPLLEDSEAVKAQELLRQNNRIIDDLPYLDEQ